MLTRVFSADAHRKSEYFLEKIQQLLSQGERIFLIVPEQMSVTYESTLASLCPPSFNFQLEVLNFSRLPNRVFREIGGLNFRPVNTTGKLLLLSRALHSLEGELQVLSADTDRPAAVERMAAQIREFEDFGVSPGQLEELSQAAKKENNLPLSRKLSDLAAIYRRYRELMDASFDDGVSEARRLAEALSRHPFFGGSYIFIEGFYDFTADQYALMRRMAVQAEEMYVGLFASRKDLEGDGFSLRAKNAAKKIALMTDKDHLQDVFLSENESIPPELSHLSRHLFSQGEVYPDPCEALHLTRCHSAYDEVCHIASTIRTLAKDGTPYSRMAVSFRNDPVYPRLCQSVFGAYGIPFHCAVVESTSHSPVFQLIRLACRIAAGDLRLGTVRKYLKTDLIPLNTEESFVLEDYALTWDLNGSLWLAAGDLVMPPQGYGAPDSQEQRELLQEINRLRRLAMEPLMRLKDGFLQSTVGEKLRALSLFLEEVGVQAKIAQKAANQRAAGDYEKADQGITLWNTLLDALRQLDLVAGDLSASPREFCDWVRLALNGCEQGTLPPAPDCVQIGEASFMRNTDVDVLFVPGLNAGIFPPDEKPCGLLLPGERELFARHSVELSHNGPEEAANEYFIFDQLLRSPSRHLFLSYHEKKTAASAPCAPSVFVTGIREIYPQLKEEVYDPENAMPTCREEAFRYYSTHYGEESQPMELLREIFDKDPRSLPLKDAKLFADSNMELARPPYGSEQSVAMTQSRLEQYTLCRYRYFSQYMLRLSSRPTAYPNAMEEGTMVHALLERFFASLYASHCTPDQLSEDEIDRRVLALCQEHFSCWRTDQKADQTKQAYLVERAAKSLGYVVKNLLRELSGSRFVPILFEAKLPDDLAPYTLSLPDGSQLKLYGKIDRVDLFTAEDNTRYVRVIDYKSSPKELRLQDVYNGLNQQMLIYLFSLWQGGLPQNGKSLEVLPAGILYVPAKRPQFSWDRDDPSQIQAKLNQKMQRRGLVLNNDEVKNAMEEGTGGIFLPKQNPDRYLATLEEFAVLQRHTEKLLKKTAMSLKQGKISPDPFASGCDSCKNCSYRAVCKFESRPTKHYEYFDNRQDVLEAMKEDVQ